MHDTHGQYAKMPRYTPAELSRMKAERDMKEQEQLNFARRQQQELQRHQMLQQANRMPMVRTVVAECSSADIYLIGTTTSTNTSTTATATATEWTWKTVGYWASSNARCSTDTKPGKHISTTKIAGDRGHRQHPFVSAADTAGPSSSPSACHSGSCCTGTSTSRSKRSG